MPEPIDPIVADLVARLNDNLREEFEERAAIIEFDANFPRRLAECLGLLDVLGRNLTGLSGVSAMQIEMDGQTQWIATTDLIYARQHLADMHAIEIAVLDLRTMIDEQYSGVAALTCLG
ncbi:MAG: hypothetical protein NTY05_14295 [Rhodocyclales bacterium]|nr:hypothetical protein [Rhodocyclales bacterium]